METKHKEKEPLSPFLKYSGIGLQLLFTIGFGTWLGIKIDQFMENKQPWAAIICSLSFMMVGLYLFIKSLPKV